ncbi:MAG: hypothetical protein MUO26_07230 [Methanotrichaceae archaeon]|nr:hypothetical protein [Methanotrichaceae archaeon]
MVTSIISGSSFEVSGIGCVRLADIMSSSENTLSGLKAREFTRDQLMGTQVFLDLDNKTGREPDGCWQAVVYKSFRNGTPN